MSGYLEEYGAGEEKKQYLIRNTILIVLAVAIVGGLGIYLLRPLHQINVTKHFLSLLKSKDYQGAYAAWGCGQASDCKEYSFDKFMEDWGPKSSGADSPVLRISDIESCGHGEILTVNVAAARREKLWMEKGSDALSFSPVAICPGKGAWTIMAHRTVGRLRQVFF
jgi:hypothetical protein